MAIRLHTAWSVFLKRMLSTLTLSIVSTWSLYWPILPMAMPRPLMNVLSVRVISVELALKEMLSSRLCTVQLRNVK